MKDSVLFAILYVLFVSGCIHGHLLSSDARRYHWSQVTVYGGEPFPVGSSRGHGKVALERHRWNEFPTNPEDAEPFITITPDTISIRFDTGVQSITGTDRKRFLARDPTRLANGMVVRFSASDINSIGLPGGDLYIMSPSNTIAARIFLVELTPALPADKKDYKRKSNKPGGR